MFLKLLWKMLLSSGIDLTEEDIGTLFILFKTEIEVLDKRA